MKDQQRYYQLFASLYRGREDVIARWQGDRYVTLSGSGGLTFERFLKHITMEETYAIYNKDDEGRVSFGLFDVDVIPRSIGWQNILAALGEKKKEIKKIISTLYELGLARENFLLEFPTVGFHLLLFFDRPVSAAALKEVMFFICRKASLEHLPFYPHKVLDSPWGDRVQLPFRLNNNTGKRSNLFEDLDSFDPLRYREEPDFSPLEKVKPIDVAWVSEIITHFGL